VNTLALGGTRFIMQRLYGVVGAYAPRNLVPMPRFNLEFLSGNPVLESLFSGYALMEILSFVFVFLLWFYLFKTRSGLRLRSVGLNETAAKTAGINVDRTKFIAIVMSGVFAGIAGSHLSTSYTKMFVEGMSGGRGYMAIAAMNFGGGNPVSALIAALIFGFSESLGLRLQGSGFPSQFVLMIPYLVTIITLTVSMVQQDRKEKKEKIRELSRQREELSFPK
jgi:simple sugar transport system permease protein